MPPLLGARLMRPTVAALYVQKNGCYFGLSDVDDVSAPRGGLQQIHRCQLPPASAK